MHQHTRSRQPQPSGHSKTRHHNHTYMHACMHSHTCTRMHPYIHTCVHSHPPIHALVPIAASRAMCVVFVETSMYCVACSAQSSTASGPGGAGGRVGCLIGRPLSGAKQAQTCQPQRREEPPRVWLVQKSQYTYAIQ